MEYRVGHKGRLVALLLILTLLLAACGGTEGSATDVGAPDTVAPTAAPAETAADATEMPAATEGEMAAACSELAEVDVLEVEGDIIVAGSSTVFPLTEAVAEMFTDEGYAGQITIDSIGSGAGFERFCVTAETDIANASRAIKDEESEACRGNGREPIEFRVGTDALAIVVSNENDFLTQLSLEQLAAVFSGEAATWADVDPSYPDEAIQLYSPGTDSGTFDFFVEEVFDKDEEPILGAANIQFSEDDNVLVQGVEGSPYAIGYFGYAYYQENEDRLHLLAIEGVEPNLDTAESGDYPLSRPLLVYSAPSVLAEKPQAAAFLSYYLQNVDGVIEEVGYFPASVEQLGNACQAWLDAANR